MLIKNLKVTEYTEDYYDEHKEAGLDYLSHGYWQEEYAKMVTEACKPPTDGFVVDAGCACGSILKGFQKLNLRVLGADLNQHMIDIGREHFGFYANELVCGSISNLPALTESVDLVHTAQVLEHIPQEHMDDILREFARVLKPAGRAFICLDAVKDGETKEMYMGDPTHVNIQPIAYWYRLFHKHGFMFDVEAYNRFVRSEYKPTEEQKNNFFDEYPYWSVWILQKT
jgi:ubiquinone/menaquinone biosynthesis C-methylase UbiE